MHNRPMAMFISAMLVSTACSAAPQDNTAAQPSAVPVVPRDSPDTGIVNKPATAGRANAPVVQPSFKVEKIGQFDAPFALAFVPGGQLLVTEKGGALKLRAADGAVATVSGVPAIAAGGQGGLLDVALSPDFGSSRRIYLTYSEPGTVGAGLALARGTLDVKQVQCVTAPCAPVASLSNVSVIWRSGMNGPGGQFGANIAFATDNKSLFLATGERQRFTPAQDAEQTWGKILRLTLDGKAFPGNPMYKAGGVRAQTWSSGHRNPYGLAFARDGRLWEVEMGPKGGDEVNLIEAGKNYGYPLVSNGDNYSGKVIPDHPSRPDLAAPKLWWNPAISPGGMMIYSGALFPAWRGSMLISALSGKGLIRVKLDGANATAGEQFDMGARIRDVAQAPDGSVWVLEDGTRGANGNLLRLTPAS